MAVMRTRTMSLHLMLHLKELVMVVVTVDDQGALDVSRSLARAMNPFRADLIEITERDLGEVLYSYKWVVAARYEGGCTRTRSAACKVGDAWGLSYMSCSTRLLRYGRAGTAWYSMPMSGYSYCQDSLQLYDQVSITMLALCICVSQSLCFLISLCDM